MALPPFVLVQTLLILCLSSWTSGVHILLIGDSTDRNTVIRSCVHLHGAGSSFGGSDFVSRNGRTKKSWDSQDIDDRRGIEEAFPAANTTNWSDLTCWLPELQLRISTLSVFGSSSPPYFLGMCTKGAEDDGPYCNTTARIERGVGVLRAKHGQPDTVIFQSVLWDMRATSEPGSQGVAPEPFLKSYRERIQQLLRLCPSSHVALRTAPTEEEYRYHTQAEAFNAQVVRRVWQETNSHPNKNASLFLFDWALHAHRLHNQSLFAEDNCHLTHAGCVDQLLAITRLSTLMTANLLKSMYSW